MTANETKIDWLRWRALVASMGVDFAYGEGGKWVPAIIQKFQREMRIE